MRSHLFLEISPKELIKIIKSEFGEIYSVLVDEEKNLVLWNSETYTEQIINDEICEILSTKIGKQIENVMFGANIGTSDYNLFISCGTERRRIG